MKYIATIALMLAASYLGAQIQVGGMQLSKSWPQKISKTNFALLHKTTTLFVLQDRDYAHIDDFDAAIKSTWTLTPYKIIRRDELADYVYKPGYSFFTLEGNTYLDGSRNTARVTYTLWMTRKWKDRYLPRDYAQIVLHADPVLNQRLLYAPYDKNLKNSLADTLYSTRLETWGAGFLRHYLRELNRLLSYDKVHNYYQNFTNKEAITALRQDTLYIPDYVNLKVAALPFQSIRQVGRNEDDISGSYDFPVKLISSDSLNAMLIRGGKPLSYVIFTQSSINKFINIFNSGAPGLIYSTYDKTGRNFQNSDLRRMSRKVRG